VYRGLYGQGEVEASSRCCLVTGVDLPPRGRDKRVDVGMECRRRHRAGAGNKAINEAIEILPGGESLMRRSMKRS
jgi:hypothetical protein